MKELFNIQWHKFLVPSKNVLLPYNVINGKLCSLCVISYNLLYLNITKFIGSNKVKIFIVSLIHVTCCSCSFEVKSLPCGARLSISIIELPLTQSLVTTLHLAPLPSVQSEASCSVKKIYYIYRVNQKKRAHCWHGNSSSKIHQKGKSWCVSENSA